jgi:hypothetical protein
MTALAVEALSLMPAMQLRNRREQAARCSKRSMYCAKVRVTSEPAQPENPVAVNQSLGAILSCSQTEASSRCGSTHPRE